MTADCEGLNKEKERSKGDTSKEVFHAQKEDVVYDAEVMMLRFGDNRLPTKKRMWAGVDFTQNDHIPPVH